MRQLKQTKLMGNGKVGNCFATCIACILDKDIEDIPNIETLFGIDNFWIVVFDKWINSIGYEYIEIKEDEWILDIPYMANGLTSRGSMHSVIYVNGELYHDPHPSNEGLVNVKYYTAIRVIEK